MYNAYIASGNIKWYSWWFLIKLNMQLSCDIEISFWDNYPTVMKNVSSHKNLYMNLHSSLIAKNWKKKKKIKIPSKGKVVLSTVVQSGQEILISNEKQWTSIYLTTWWVSRELCWLKKRKKKTPKISHCMISFILCLWSDKIVEMDNRPVVVKNGGVEIRCGFSMAT